MPAWSPPELPLPFFQDLGFADPSHAIFGAAAAIFQCQREEEELEAERWRAEEQLAELAQSEEAVRKICRTLAGGRKGQKQLQALRARLRARAPGAGAGGSPEQRASAWEDLSPGDLLEELLEQRSLLQAVSDSCCTCLAEARRSSELLEAEYRQLLDRHRPAPADAGHEAGGSQARTGASAETAFRLLSEPALRDRYLRDNDHQAFLASKACPDWAREAAPEPREDERPARAAAPAAAPPPAARHGAAKRYPPPPLPPPTEPPSVAELVLKAPLPPPPPWAPAEASSSNREVDLSLGWLTGSRLEGSLFEFADENDENSESESSCVSAQDKNGRNGYLWQRCTRPPTGACSGKVAEEAALSSLAPDLQKPLAWAAAGPAAQAQTKPALASAMPAPQSALASGEDRNAENAASVAADSAALAAARFLARASARGSAPPAAAAAAAAASGARAGGEAASEAPMVAAQPSVSRPLPRRAGPPAAATLPEAATLPAVVAPLAELTAAPQSPPPPLPAPVAGGGAAACLGGQPLVPASMVPVAPGELSCAECGAAPAAAWHLACPVCRAWRPDLRGPAELAEAYVEDCPVEFVCPISMQLMRRPCTTSDGRLYDWASVEEWLTKHNTSPLTNVCVSKELTDDQAMSRRIEQWLESLAGRCSASPDVDNVEPYFWQAGLIPPEDDWSVDVLGKQDVEAGLIPPEDDWSVDVFGKQEAGLIPPEDDWSVDVFC